MDSGTFFQSIAGGALITAALTLAQLVFEYYDGRAKRRAESDELRRIQRRDADARLERILQDRLAEADRRLDRLQQAHDVLVEHYAALTAEHERTRGRALPGPDRPRRDDLG